MSLRKARHLRNLKRKTLLKIALWLSLILLAMALVFQVAARTGKTLNKLSREVSVVEYGSVEDRIAVSAIVINQEDVVIAPENGLFENMVKDREKVSRGALLGYFVSSTAKTPILAKTSGIYVGKVDGLEPAFASIDIRALPPDIFNLQAINAAEDQPIQSGAGICKIIDSLKPTELLIRFKTSDIDWQISPEREVKINQGSNVLGAAAIKGSTANGDDTFMLLKCHDTCEELLGQRYVKLDVVFATYNGYLIPESSVVEKDGKRGIYCANGENISFKPIRIIKQDGDILVVEGLNQNDLLINNPPQ